MTIPSLDDIRKRHAELSRDIIRTPTLTATSGIIRDAMGGAELRLKAELFQHTGTFKARGALSCVRAIPEAERRRGITAVSAGNHAIAAAWAARQYGLDAKVVMMKSANPLRVAAARAEGATVVMTDDAHAAFAEVERLQEEEGRVFVHPYEGINTSLGAAGVGLELMEDAADRDAVVVSVGGGGLISGVSMAVKLLNPECRVYAVEPTGAPSLNLSLKQGEPVRLDAVRTLADSLGAPFALPYSFGLCQRYVDQAVLLSDDEICAGMALFQEELNMAVEPAAGAVLAGALGPLRDELAGKRVGLVVCGANIDTQGYAGLILRGRDHVGALLA